MHSTDTNNHAESWTAPSGWTIRRCRGEYIALHRQPNGDIDDVIRAPSGMTIKARLDAVRNQGGRRAGR